VKFQILTTLSVLTLDFLRTLGLYKQFVSRVIERPYDGTCLERYQILCLRQLILGGSLLLRGIF